MLAKECCRFCLCEDRRRTYLSLHSYQHSEILSSQFGLTSDFLESCNLYPAHVCDECHLVIHRFIKLTIIAKENQSKFDKSEEIDVASDNYSTEMLKTEIVNNDVDSAKDLLAMYVDRNKIFLSIKEDTKLIDNDEVKMEDALFKDVYETDIFKTENELNQQIDIGSRAENCRKHGKHA